MDEHVAALLSVDDGLLRAHPDVFGHDPSSRCVALAEALATSPAWARLRARAALAVRPSAGLIGVLGAVSREDRPLLDALGWQVEDLLRRLLPVSFPDVERACFELAARLREELSPAELQHARVVAVPRGGLIVAGVVAYALGLSRDQLQHDARTDAVTILVDDCALSGTRLRESLADHREGQVVVALLHAHPDLAARVEEQEQNVRRVLVARDLQDHALGRPDHAEWKERWIRRSPHELWTGEGDHVCYPWNEPDVLIWNSVTERAEPGWHVVPPSWCIKNRADSRSGDVQRCDPGSGALQPAAQVVWAKLGDTVLVAQPGASALAFRGSAALMWETVARSGGALPAMAGGEAGGAARSRHAPVEFDRFVAMLTDRGLLRSGTAGPSAAGGREQ